MIPNTSAPTRPTANVSGGDMYYDVAAMLEQLGLVNVILGKSKHQIGKFVYHKVAVL